MKGMIKGSKGASIGVISFIRKLDTKCDIKTNFC